MTSLPTEYMRVARDITGYWGTYPLSKKLTPGMVGIEKDGVFIEESNLSRFKGYDPKKIHMGPSDDVDSNSVWLSQNVRVEVLGAQASTPGIQAKTNVKLHFDAANKAAIICNGLSGVRFADIIVVKEFLRKLRDENLWSMEYCLITEVLTTKSGHVLFSTDKNQVAELTTSAELSLPTVPVEILKAIAPSASISGKSNEQRSASFWSDIKDGGTPLFRALKFNKNFFGLGGEKIDYVKGNSNEFEEPSFGEPQLESAP